MARLPVPGYDDGNWGDILNEFLEVEHNNDGTLKTNGTLANKVDSTTTINGKPLKTDITLTPDDIDDTSSSSKFLTAEEQAKLNTVAEGADVTNAASVAAAGAVMSSALASNAATNVKLREDPLKNAVGDGSSHPLSERFSTLVEAQAVFPRATSLNEQIDRHALQEALDNNPAVYAPEGEYQIDAPVYGGDGTYSQDYNNQTLIGDGMWLTKFQYIGGPGSVIVSGNSRNVVTLNNPPSSEAPAGTNCTWKDFAIEGNGSGAGLRLYHQNQRLIDGVRVTGCTTGIRDYGVTDAQTSYAIYRNIYVHNNSGTGLQVSLRNRHVHYESILAISNNKGVMVDHSQSRILSVTANDNTTYGMELRNSFESKIYNLTVQGNGQHGIYCWDFEEMQGGNWYVSNNGQSAANTYDDIHFTDALGGDYNNNCTINNVMVGHSPSNSLSSNSRNFIHVTDNNYLCRFTNVQLMGTANAAAIRLPSPSEGNSVTFSDGSDWVNTVSSSGSVQTIAFGGTHDITMSENCSFSFSNLPSNGVSRSCTVVVRGSFQPTFNAVTWAGSNPPDYQETAVYQFTYLGGSVIAGRMDAYDMAGSNPPSSPTVSYLGNFSSNSDSATYSFTNQDLGPESSDRVLVMAISTRRNGSANIANVNVGGVSPTQIIQHATTQSTATNSIALAIFEIPSGTSGDVQITFENSTLRCSCAMWRMTGLNSVSPVDSVTASSSNPLSASLNTQADGIALGLGAITSNSNGSSEWTGLTEDFDFVTDNAYILTGARATTDGTPLSIATSFVKGGSHPNAEAGLYVSFR